MPLLIVWSACAPSHGRCRCSRFRVLSVEKLQKTRVLVENLPKQCSGLEMKNLLEAELGSATVMNVQLGKGYKAYVFSQQCAHSLGKILFQNGRVLRVNVRRGCSRSLQREIFQRTSSEADFLGQQSDGVSVDRRAQRREVEGKQRRLVVRRRRESERIQFWLDRDVDVRKERAKSVAVRTELRKTEAATSTDEKSDCSRKGCRPEAATPGSG